MGYVSGSVRSFSHSVLFAKRLVLVVSGWSGGTCTVVLSIINVGYVSGSGKEFFSLSVVCQEVSASGQWLVWRRMHCSSRHH